MLTKSEKIELALVCAVGLAGAIIVIFFINQPRNYRMKATYQLPVIVVKESK